MDDGANEKMGSKGNSFFARLDKMKATRRSMVNMCRKDIRETSTRAVIVGEGPRIWASFTAAILDHNVTPLRGEHVSSVLC